MPEGPEVKTIASQLDAVLPSRTLRGVDILSGRYERHKPPTGLASMNLPAVCERVGCKGKFIYFVMMDAGGNRTTIWNTLGMTGFWSRTQEEHARMRFRFDIDLYFCDMRNFGTMSFGHTLEQLSGKLESLGFDLLEDRVDEKAFKAQLMRRKKKLIVETLMDQSITAGVGNYIKCEALYHSGISPHRVTGSLSDDEFKRLQGALVHVMASSYQAKGHTMSDYRDLEGAEGRFKFELAVYNRSRDPKGNPVIREETKDGRTTHWVPGLQV